MRIALIGMSGTGKSYWSHCLNGIGFACFSCDDHIGRRLARQQGLTDGTIESIGRWMGFPYEPGFAEREARYLELEARALDRCLDEMERPPGRSPPPCVIDTTGSVIYLEDDLLERLRRAAVVVYLAASAEKRQALLDGYRACPRPVIWQGRFRRNPGEDPAEALARCYMGLVDERDRRYRRLAHMAVDLPVPAPSPADTDLLLGPVRAFLEENARATTS
ncbi:MAG: hypothetical protein QNI89_12260 [Desulfobacterales bacterium]|nr:hypothetical protein [Desulfobacterales bacterium]MDJ0855483.1 hypothetical protein [Desulfobacterales bacterium]MDJ0888073.1 hypothetical protein [Desulfobacterales bacterium]MDJ0989651.1 hypothetical protein [Desulfobacterales bacterium]